MKYFRRFLTLSRAKQIAIVVCSIHVFAIFALTCHHFASKQMKPAKNIIVRTVLPQIEKKIIPIPAKSQASAPAAKPKPSPAKPKTVAAAKKPSPLKEQKLLKEISKSLDSLSKESKQPRPAISVPKKIAPKEEIVAIENPSYGEFLVSYLQTALDLPEYGEVKARLEIDRFGKLIDCEILETKSFKNAEFLKSQLPQLTFPYLNDFGIVDATHSFTITFRNMDTNPLPMFK